jgi:hypothetical protein
LYEKENKDGEKNGKEDTCVIISEGEGRNIFSGFPIGITQFLNKIGHFDNQIFDPENDIISIENYNELLEIIKYLIDIIQLDLTKAYTDSKRYDLLNVLVKTKPDTC